MRTAEKKSAKSNPLSPLRHATISAAALRDMDKDEKGYIVLISVKRVQKLFPQIDGLPKNPSTMLFLAVRANGIPLALSDRRPSAVGSILAEQLVEVPIH
jgi:hypothetical protein